MKELTKAEEQIMQILWKLDEAFVKEIIDKLPNPKPAYNTVSTIVRILEKKGFVAHTAFGKSPRYFPLVKKEDYTKVQMKSFVNNYFSNSCESMVSFFAKEQSISINEMEEIMKVMEKEIQKQKGD